MEHLFNDSPSAEVEDGVTLPPYWHNTRQKIHEDLGKMMDHVQSRSYSVSNSHLLVRMLRDLNVSPDLDVVTFRHKVTERAPGIAHAHGVATNLQPARWPKESHFYGELDEEFFVLTEDEITFSKAEENWAMLRPVEVIRHPRTDLSMSMLTGETRSRRSGRCLLRIDLVKLALQYYHWYHAEAQKDHGFNLTTRHFVYAYPLVNLLISHLDVALFNRLACHYEGKVPDETEHDAPIHVRSHDKAVDRYLLERVKTLSQRDEAFETRLEQIGLIFHSDLRRLIHLPDMILNRRNSWIILFARVPVFELLLKLDWENGSTRNLKHYRTIERRLRAYRGDQGLESMLPLSVYDELLDELSRRIEPYLT